MDKECDNSNNSELSIQEIRCELSKTISKLKTYISLLESMIEAPKVDQSQITKEESKLLHDGEAATFHDEPDVQMELRHNIYQFARVRCINFKRDSRFIFEISDSENIARNDSYMMEILIENGHGKLGNCVLPDFINVHNILWQYPIDDLNNVKYFLKSCKHNIDCYFSRLKQINELKNLFLKIRNGSICHSNDVTLIELTMYNVKDVYTNETYDVKAYLHYYTDKIQPYKLSASTNDIEVRPPLFHRRLNMYFMPFLKKNLSSAFMQIITSYDEFNWQKVIVESEDNVELYEYEEKLHDNGEDVGYVDHFLCRRNRSLKRSKDKI